MTRQIVLDSGPLGLLVLPPTHPAAAQTEHWFRTLTAVGLGFAVPEIADYELRRELLRLEKSRSLAQFDLLLDSPGVSYLPFTTRAMRLAAQLWADVRRAGRPTADRNALDADVILAAQARLLADDGHDVLVATTNVRHLSLFIPAAEWWKIAPDA